MKYLPPVEMENVAYDPVQRIELRDNMAYGPDLLTSFSPGLLFVNDFNFSISNHFFNTV